MFYRGVGIMTEKQKSDIIGMRNKGMSFSKMLDTEVRFKVGDSNG